MASQSGVSKPASFDVNQGACVLLEWFLTSALANAETVTLTLPLGVNKGLHPILVQAFTPATPRIAQPLIALTSYSPLSGTIVLTASGVVANGSSVRILMVPCGL